MCGWVCPCSLLCVGVLCAPAGAVLAVNGQKVAGSGEACVPERVPCGRCMRLCHHLCSLHMFGSGSSPPSPPPEQQQEQLPPQAQLEMEAVEIVTRELSNGRL